LAARTHTYAARSRGAASDRRRSNHRATLALLCGLVAAIVIPLAIYVTRKVSGAVLLDAAWAIPVAAVLAVASLMLERGARRRANRSLEQARGSRRLMAARVLAITGICLALSSALSVGIYEFLVWKETH
jgi:hypothetical protein